MIRSEARIPGISWVLAFMAATIMALAWAPTAMAQQVDQYGGTTAPSGPAAGETATVTGDEDGVVGPGDVIVIAGDFVVTEGASVTLQDSDGTQGTLIDGQNANITEGSIIIEVTGEPAGVVGGNGVLNTDGLFVVATTGIFAASEDGAVDDGAAVDDNGAAVDDNGAAVEDGTQAGASTGNGTSAQASTGGGAGAGAGAVDDSAGSGSSEDGAAVAVLPDTGGSILAFVLAGGLLLIGAGFVIRRLAGSN